jgi:integrase/recombinase XerD
MQAQAAIVLSEASQPWSVELAIAVWLDAKAKRSGSPATAQAYETTLATFRQALRRAGRDLDSDARSVALVAQAWLSRTHDGTAEVGPATFNQRRAILSSFYAFALRRELLDPAKVSRNPLALLDARPVQDYAGAVPLDEQTVAARLAQIDRSTLAGVRDYALLLVGLHTGRRAAELAGLRLGDLDVRGEDGTVLVNWRHCKGGKVMRDELVGQTAAALVRYLAAVYGVSWPQDAPVWVTLARNLRGTPLSVRSIATICERRLGTGKIHALRHTFAVQMEKAGAPVSLIQQRLGHSSLAVTGRYLAKLTSASNPYAERLEAAFGLSG